MRHNTTCGLHGYNVFFHIISWTARFSKNVSAHKTCVLIFFTTLSETFLILRRMLRDVVINYVGLPVKYPLLLSDFNLTWTFTTDFRKILKYKILWKSARWEPSCSLRTDGQADMTKLIDAFRNFAKAPKKRNRFWLLTQCIFLYSIYQPINDWIKYINLLKPTGHVMHHQFNIQQLYALPTLYLCVLYLSENKQRLVPLTA